MIDLRLELPHTVEDDSAFVMSTSGRKSSDFDYQLHLNTNLYLLVLPSCPTQRMP